MLDAFEAKRKRASKPIFEVEQWAIGGGYYVRATLPDGTVDRIEGFAAEGDAGRWIKNESVVWLANRARDERKHEERQLPPRSTPL
jgi:hypothetical protein